MSFKKSIPLLLALVGIAFLLAITQRIEAQGPQTIFSGKFYNFDVIAVDGQPNLTTISGAPSINDNGVVAFIGRNPSSNVFKSEALSAYTSLNSSGFANAMSGFCQINNSK